MGLMFLLNGHLHRASSWLQHNKDGGARTWKNTMIISVEVVGKVALVFERQQNLIVSP